MNTRSRQRVGRIGEDLAVDFLSSQGVTILERNYRRRGFEIDIIARDPIRGIVFVEVRTRRSNSAGTGWESLTEQKLRHVRNGALHWLAARGISSPVVVDGIVVNLTSRVASIEYRQALL